jgi:hypothetical protein
VRKPVLSVSIRQEIKKCQIHFAVKLVCRMPTRSVCYSVVARVSRRGPSTDRYSFDALYNPAGAPGFSLTSRNLHENCIQRWQSCHNARVRIISTDIMM